MEYTEYDSSGTDDDLPPTHQNRGAREHVPRDGRTGDALQYPRVHNDMETQIHLLEQEAYSSVLRAFKAQADAITWEKAGLITELRKELRLSDEEHRELLNRVNADEIIRRIREWRQSGGSLLNNAQSALDPVPSPTVSASRKRQKMSQSVPSLSLGAPPNLHLQPITPGGQQSSPAKRGRASAARGKKPKSGRKLPPVSSMKSTKYPPIGSGEWDQIASRSGQTGVLPSSQLIGQKVMTRWPEDNSFYEAVITDYDAIKGLHALVYDMHTENETWEWVNLKEISPEDIRWEGDNPAISNRAVQGGPRQRFKKSTARGGALPSGGRGKGSLRNQSKLDILQSQNGVRKNISGDIQILHTETLVKEVERVLAANRPDPLELEKAKKALKEHEQSLIEVIQMIAESSVGENVGEHQYSHGRSQPMNCDPGWNNHPHGGNQHGDTDQRDMRDEVREGYEGGHLAGDGGASDYRHIGGDDN